MYQNSESEKKKSTDPFWILRALCAVHIFSIRGVPSGSSLPVDKRPRLTVQLAPNPPTCRLRTRDPCVQSAHLMQDHIYLAFIGLYLPPSFMLLRSNTLNGVLRRFSIRWGLPRLPPSMVKDLERRSFIDYSLMRMSKRHQFWLTRARF